MRILFFQVQKFSDLQSTVASRSKHLQKICSELKENGTKFPLSDYVKGIYKKKKKSNNLILIFDP